MAEAFDSLNLIADLFQCLGNSFRMLTLDLDHVSVHGPPCSANVFQLGQQFWQIIATCRKPLNQRHDFSLFSLLGRQSSLLLAGIGQRLRFGQGRTLTFRFWSITSFAMRRAIKNCPRKKAHHCFLLVIGSWVIVPGRTTTWNHRFRSMTTDFHKDVVPIEGNRCSHEVRRGRSRFRIRPALPSPVPGLMPEARSCSRDQAPCSIGLRAGCSGRDTTVGSSCHS